MKSTVKNRVQTIAGIVILFWIIEIINMVMDYKLGTYGIKPRSLIGLRGIIFSPFIHHGIYHLVANTIPFIILGSFIIIRGIDDFFQLSLLIMVVGGAGVWIFGRSALHVGASGLIFGYFGFLVAAGWFEKKLLSILISIVVIFLYGGLIFGVLPSRPFISWEGHLFGLLAGIAGARLLKPSK